MDLGDFFSQVWLRMTTGCKKVQNGTQVLGSFFSVNGSGIIFFKVLFKNNRLIVFSLVCNFVNFKNN